MSGPTQSTTSILPTWIWPNTVDDAKARLKAAAGGTDASVQACPNLDQATKTSWALFYSAVTGFTNESTSIWGLGSQMDRAESYNAELLAWQQKLSPVCPGILAFAPSTPPSDLITVLQYLAWGAGIVAVAYSIGKVVEVMPKPAPRLPETAPPETRRLPARNPGDWLIEIIQSKINPSLQLAFVPDVVRVMQNKPYALTLKRAHEFLIAYAEEGEIELRPEGGINRLTPEEKRLSIPGPHQTVLSWVRVR